MHQRLTPSAGSHSDKSTSVYSDKFPLFVLLAYIPTLAAILAAAEAFGNDLSASASFLLNSLNWQTAPVLPADAPFVAEPDLGALWTVGAGSVGTAILYFLSLATRNFAARLFDMDVVKVHNLDRSPLFMARQVGMTKVAAVVEYLKAVGVSDAQAEPLALDESPVWRDRLQGVPDILVAAANERNVRTVTDLRHDRKELAGGGDPPFAP